MTVTIANINPPMTLICFSYSGLIPRTHECMIQEVMYAVQRGITLQYNGLAGGAHLCKSRSHALTQWWKTQDTLSSIMIDHDMEWTPGDAIETARLAYAHQSIVGGLYAKKQFGGGHTCCQTSGEATFQIGGSTHNAVHCDRIGTGFLGVSRVALDKIWDELNWDGEKFQDRLLKAYHAKDLRYMHLLDQLSISMCCGDPVEGKPKDPEDADWFRCMRIWNSTGGAVHISEDFSFCERARFAGVRPMINLKPWLIHHGNYGFDPNCGKQDHPCADPRLKSSTTSTSPAQAPAAGSSETTSASPDTATK